MPKFHVGGFASGLVGGIMKGAQLRRMGRQDVRDAKEMEREAAREGAYTALADLAETFTGPYKPPAPIGAASGTAAGAAAGGINVGQAASMPDLPSPSFQDGPSTGVPARRGVAVDGQLPEAAGPKTPDDRLGFALWRQPALLSHPEFVNGAAQIFLKAGMPEGVKWLERGARAQQENALTALRHLTAGDPQAAEEAFNSGGQIKLEPGTLRPLEDGRWQATLVGGRIHTFDPRKMMRSFLSPREFLELDRRERADAATATHRTRVADDQAAHRERTAEETERHHRATEANQRRAIDVRAEAPQGPRSQPVPTALQRNLEHLVSIGVAKDQAEAFKVMRTAMGKPEKEAVLSLAKELMRRPGYLGPKGQARAIEDARTILRSVASDGATAPPADPARAPAAAGRPPLESFFQR